MSNIIGESDAGAGFIREGAFNPDDTTSNNVDGTVTGNIGNIGGAPIGEVALPAAQQAEPMMQFFAYGHLPPHLRAVSAQFFQLAAGIVDHLPRNPERTVALRKLLEAKDCAVRAVLYR